VLINEAQEPFPVRILMVPSPNHGREIGCDRSLVVLPNRFRQMQLFILTHATTASLDGLSNWLFTN